MCVSVWNIHVVRRLDKIIISFFFNLLEINAIFLCHLPDSTNRSCQSHYSWIELCTLKVKLELINQTKPTSFNPNKIGAYTSQNTCDLSRSSLLLSHIQLQGHTNLWGNHEVVQEYHAEDRLSQIQVKPWNSLLTLDPNKTQNVRNINRQIVKYNI